MVLVKRNLWPVMIFIVAGILGGCNTVNNVAKPDAAKLQAMIQDRNFIFEAENMTPMRGSLKVLTSPYDVTLRRDSLISYLPFFGRAYQAPLNPADAGLIFTSTNFSYNISSGSKGRWHIVIVPNDHRDVQEMNFTIFDNATATLNVINLNRDPISFSGRIVSPKLK